MIEQDRPWSRWRWAAFNFRRSWFAFWNAWGFILLGAKSRPEMPELSESSHPSQLCKCACGPDGRPGQHAPECPWLVAMCKTCEGGGYCPECHGEGIGTFANETCTVCGKLGHWSPDCPTRTDVGEINFP